MRAHNSLKFPICFLMPLISSGQLGSYVIACRTSSASYPFPSFSSRCRRRNCSAVTVEDDLGGTKKTLRFEISLLVGNESMIALLSAVANPCEIEMSLWLNTK